MRCPFPPARASLRAIAGVFVPLAAVLLVIQWAQAAEGVHECLRAEAVMLLEGQDVGRYSEETVREHGQIRDTTEQELVLNRLGSRVEMRDRQVEVQDAKGRLLAGHYESTASRTTMTTDFTVKDHSILLTTASGGKSYTRTLPFTGELAGAEALRIGLKHAKKGKALHLQTFVPELGAVTEVTVVSAGHETLQIEGRPVDTLRLESTIGGVPSPSTLWVDAQGYTVRALQTLPFGKLEIRRGHPPAASPEAQLPVEIFERTVVESGVHLPHPRRLQRVTLEISARKAAGIDWPDLSSRTQHVRSRTPQAVVLEIARSEPGAYRDGGGKVDGKYLAPNVLLQSDDEQVRQIAQTVAGDEKDPWKVALALQRWVNQNMTFDAGIAVAPAAEVARDRHGTCVGYAVLLASLARARGIPSRMVMGYVYEGRIWGGHAWTEVLIEDQWRALDAAEYAPEVADAARFGVIREAGDSGTLEGIGEIAKLFSRINVRVLSYQLGERTVEVPASAADHTVEGDIYVNPWLGLTVVKPQAAVFTEMDAHWPAAPVAVTVTLGDTSAQVFYFDAVTPASDLVASLLGTPDSPPEALQWQGLPALRARSKDQEILAAAQGDITWGVLARGPASHALLDSLLPKMSIAPQ